MDVEKIEKVILTTVNIPDGELWDDFKAWVAENDSDGGDFANFLLWSDQESSIFDSTLMYLDGAAYIPFDDKVVAEIKPFRDEVTSLRFLSLAPESEGGCKIEIRYMWYDRARAELLRHEALLSARNARGIELENDGKTLRSVPTTTKSLSIPSTVRYFDQYTFSECNLLEEVVVPEGVETISWNAFAGLPKLKKVQLPSSICRIEAFAFSGCVSLKQINIPMHLDHCGHSVLKGCPSFEGRPILSGDGTQLIAYYNPPEEVVVPEGVVEIVGHACEHCRQIRKVSLPKSLQTVGERSFWGCFRISEVELRSNVDISAVKFLSLPNAVVRHL